MAFSNAQLHPIADDGERDPEQWKLAPMVNAKVIGILLALSLLLSVSAKRNELDRLPGILAGCIGEAIGITRPTDTGLAIKRLGNGLFPMILWEKIDVSRVEHFDPKHLPLGGSIVREPIKEYDALARRWVIQDTRDFLFDPLGYLKRVILLMLQTIEIAIWGTLIALMFAIPQAYFAARGYSPNRFTYSIARFWTSFTRATPEVVLALIVVMIFGFGAIAGVVTLAFSTSGFLGKFLADDIENADKGPQEALRSLGANKLKVLRYAVLPQVMPQYLAYIQYILERNVRAATAIGVVGAGGIGLELRGRWDLYDYGHFSTLLAVMYITTLSLERLTQYVRAKMI